MIRIISLLLTFCLFNAISYTQRGKDGVKSITGTEVVNEYSYLTADATSGSTTITAQSATLNTNGRFSSSLSPGDLLFIYNAQGAQLKGAINTIDPTRADPQDITWGEILSYGNVGLREFAEVLSVSGNQITLMCPLIYDHTVSGVNEKVVVVRVPRYQSLDVSGVLTCDDWDGNTGGIVVVEVLGATNITGQVDVSGKGFRGGELNANSGNYQPTFTGTDNTYGGEKGESIGGYKSEYDIYGGEFGRGAAANGGGGGNAHNGGGAGGANASSGVLWTGFGVTSTSPAWELEQVGLSNSRSSGGGRGGNCHSSQDEDALTLPPGDPAWGGHGRQAYGGVGGRPLDYSTGRIFFGGGGGSGHQNDTEGGAGGNAAGIIVIHAFGDVVANDLLANGNEGLGSDQETANLGEIVNRDGSGGGGAGGTILVTSAGNITTSNIEAKGGEGGNQVLDAGVFAGDPIEAAGPGGGGGGGYIGISNLGSGNFDVAGGINGTTNSDGLTEFPENGASSGDSGLVQTLPANYHFYGNDTTICGGASVTITPTIIGTLPTGSGQLEWFDSYFSQTPIATGNTFVTPLLSSTTTYYFGGCGIPFKDSVRITVSTPIVIDTSAMVLQDETCAGMDGAVSGITVTGGLGSLSYYWNGNPASGPDTSGLSGITLALVVDDSVGCSDTVSNLIIEGTQVPKLDTSFKTVTPDSCENNTGAISGLFVTGGSGSYTRYLDGTPVGSLNIKNLATGTYTVAIEDNSSGCRDSIVVYVGEVTAPADVLGNDTILCNGQTVTLDATTPNATYLWQDASTNATFFVDTTGEYTVEVSIGSCTTKDSVIVTYVNGTTIDLGNDTTLCDNEQLLLDATVPNGTYIWQDNSSQPTYNVTTGGQYHVEVNQNGCIVRDTILVDYISFTLDLGNDTNLCNDDILLIDVTTPGATSYQWNTGSTDSLFQITGAGNYSVTISVGNCTKQDDINVSYAYTPEANVGNDTAICEGEGFVVDVTTTGVSYLWDDGTISPSRYINRLGEYIITLTNSCGSDSDTLLITEADCSCDVYIPNAFTPNNNGLNEAIIPQFACDLDLFELRIYSRQGILVYSSTSTVQGETIWTGEYKGGVNEAETYAYILRYRVKGEIPIRYRDGHINLIR